ncbi:MAG: coproporphyrinogen III oxidase family protein [Phycisphaerae bacterium]|nr:coproporphyrinogen III oxidase family protein [Phycisphaerae bacterium]NUQ47100.1 coproporphyrinogen III oxidase family protein [Phycisphaerae bacterium]
MNARDIEQPAPPASSPPGPTTFVEPETGSYFVSTYPPFSTWTAAEIPAVHEWLNAPPAEPLDAPLGLYVHIPFCARRCDYCYYLSYADKTADDRTAYVACLLDELAIYRDASALAGRTPTFVYFGGGTPSLLDEHQLAALLAGVQARFSWHRVREATFECAPKSVTSAKLRLLRDAGVTRISLGVQQLDDDVLRANGRVHLVRDALRAYDAIRSVGFDVVNVDLIAGLLGQTEASFRVGLDRVIALRPESVTIYLLEVPHNTPLYRRWHADAASVELVEWDRKRAWLADGFARLEAAGYTVRSAYAAVMDPPRRRFVYQDEQYRGADLLGVGASAFSYLGGVHVQNMAALDEHAACVRAGRLPLARARRLTFDERLIREFVLQLKLGTADVPYFDRKFGVDIRTRFAGPLIELQQAGALTVTDSAVRVTRPGLLRIDTLLKAFYRPEHRAVRYT